MTSEMKRGFEVMQNPCDQCLFSKNKIVSDQRRKEILQTCAREQTHFSCHKGTMEGKDVCCHGFYRAFPYNSVGMRFAAAMGIVLFVTLDEANQEVQE